PMPPESTISPTSKRSATTVPGSRIAPTMAASSLGRSSRTSLGFRPGAAARRRRPTGVFQGQCTNASVQVRWGPPSSPHVSRFGVPLLLVLAREGGRHPRVYGDPGQLEVRGARATRAPSLCVGSCVGTGVPERHPVVEHYEATT